MGLVDLNTYIRIHLNNKWTPLVKGSKCEKCGATENLKLHHIDRFVKLLDDVLVLLDLEHKDSTEYTVKELKMIRLMMQGLHLEIRTKTLCLGCHNNLHKKEDKKVVPKLKLKKIKTINSNELTKSQKRVLDKLHKIKNNTEYRDELIKLGYLNERGLKKAGFRELCGISSRQTFRLAVSNDAVQDFLIKNNITITEKGHYINI